MKKKIINGILMVALMFATTSSFVSCKDNMDDELIDVYAQLTTKRAELQKQIDDLQDQISKIEPKIVQEFNDYSQHITEVTETRIINVSDSVINVINNTYSPQITQLNQRIDSVNNQLAIVDRWITNFTLYQDSINNVLNIVDGRLNGIDNDLETIFNRLDELEKLIKTDLITKFDIDGTYSPVFGTWNLPMIQARALAAYYGSNDAGIDRFPQAGYDFEVGGKQYATYLEQNEIGSDICYFDNVYITDAVGNAGKVFFTVLPTDLDLSKYEITIEDRSGKANPIQLTNVQKSDADLTWSLGKVAGFVRTGQIVDNGAYEADATIAEENLDAIKFGVEKFVDFQKIGKQVKQAIENIQDADANGQYIAVSTQIVKEASNLVFDLLHNDLTVSDISSNASYSPQRIALSASQDGVKVRKALTNLDLFTTAVMPLSYNTFFEYEKAKDNNWIIEVALERAVARIAKEIKERLDDPTVHAKIVELDEEDDMTVIVQVGAKREKVHISNVPMWTNLKKAIEVNGGLDKVNAMINEVLKEVGLRKTVNKSAQRVNEYLDKVSNYIVTLINGHALTRSVSPIIVFETTEGVSRLAEGMFIRSGVMSAYLTSPTSELLVPAYKKYVAVVDANGNLRQSALLNGNALTYDFDLTEPGDYTVILSCVDYFGYVVTKKYNIHVL